MPTFLKVRSFLRNLFSIRRVEVDLDEEVRSHLELLTEENIRAGMSPKEAQRAARIEPGGIEQVKEQVRDAYLLLARSQKRQSEIAVRSADSSVHNRVSGFSAGLDYSWTKTPDHQLQA